MMKFAKSIAVLAVLVAVPAAGPVFAAEPSAGEPVDRVTTGVRETGLKQSPEQSQSLSSNSGNRLPEGAETEINRLAKAIRRESRAISHELRDDEEVVVKDIAMLWQGAVEQSGSIRYAIEKLSRRDATGQPVENDGMLKTIAKGAVRMVGAGASMMTGTPSGVIGGNMIEDLLLSNPIDSAYSRVTDADMVILAKEVESLQSHVITLYYKYRHRKQQLALAQEATLALSRYYDELANRKDVNPVLLTAMTSLLESAKQDEREARQAFLNVRSELAFTAGETAVTAMEQANVAESAG